LKIKWKARSLKYAKNLIRLQTNVKTREFKKGEMVYQEGDEGKSMFLVDEAEGGRLLKRIFLLIMYTQFTFNWPFYLKGGLTFFMIMLWFILTLTVIHLESLH